MVSASRTTLSRRGGRRVTARALRVCVAITLVVASTLVNFIATPARVPVAAAAPSTGVAATLTDYWNGNAHWSLFRNLPESKYPNTQAGVNFYIVGGVWYWVHRNEYRGQTCAGNPNSGPLGVVIQQSTDQGLTWSAPVNMLSPGGTTTGGDAAWGCIATDGGLYYDPAVGPGGTWRYLFQCVDNGAGTWNGCYVERTGSSPMGAFTTPTGVTNPAIPSRSIWNKICDLPADKCVILEGGVAGKVGGEGTFSIMKKDAGGYFWVDFSGAGESGLWYNGIAKTTNFVNWVAGTPADGVPSDAVLSKGMADSWRESWITPPGNVGFGLGTAFEETVGGVTYDYLLAEAQDLIGGCVAGQHWDNGLFRTTPTDMATNTWAQFPGTNPIIYSSTTPELVDLNGVQKNYLCNAAYVQLFKDPATGAIYLTLSRGSIDKANHNTLIYRLDKMTNVLQNGDFWTANETGWNFTAGMNHVVYRSPNSSPDGSQYLEFNCGGACAGKSANQTANVTAFRGQTLQYGGTFATDGNGQSLTVKVSQYNSVGTLLIADSTVATLNNLYVGVKGLATIQSTATTLTYELIPSGQYNYCADDLFANVGTGTTTPTGPAGRICRERWLAQDTYLTHSTGVAVGATEWQARTGLDAAPAYMQAGPYVSNVAVGGREASWRLKIDNNTFDNANIATLEIYDFTTASAVASRVLKRNMWTTANTYQDFQLPFTVAAGHSADQLEFRINWTGAGTVTEQSVMEYSSQTYQRHHAFDPLRYHQIGAANGDGWRAVPGNPVGYLSYGPYTSQVAGANVAFSRLKIDNITLDNANVATLELFDFTSGLVIASRTLTRHMWWGSGVNVYQDFGLSYNIDPAIAGHQFEFRVTWLGNSTMQEQQAFFDRQTPFA